MVVVPEIPHGIWDGGTCWAPWLQDDAVIGKATICRSFSEETMYFPHFCQYASK